MGKVKDLLLRKQEEGAAETGEDIDLAWNSELEHIQSNQALASYVLFDMGCKSENKECE
jgi:hypothetical protein